MSLSKHFKHSDSFQPEDLFKSSSQNNSGWKASEKKTQPDPFQANDKESITHLSEAPGETEPFVSKPLPGATEEQNDETSQSSADKLPGTEKIESSSEIPDPEKYIEISLLKTKLAEAFDAGIQNGLEKAEEDYGSAMRSLNAICQQLDTIRETIIANSSQEMQEFALAIAERIIRTSLRDNSSTIIATIEEALQRAVKSDEFYIYIHPEDYDIVVKKSNELIAGVSGLNNIVIKKDVTVEKGGAKIESDNCTIDATISSQFDVIQEEIKKTFKVLDPDERESSQPSEK